MLVVEGAHLKWTVSGVPKLRLAVERPCGLRAPNEGAPLAFDGPGTKRSTDQFAARHVSPKEALMLHATRRAAVATALAGLVADSATLAAPVDFEQVFAAPAGAPTFSRPDVSLLLGTSRLLASEDDPSTTGVISPLDPDPWWIVVASVVEGPAQGVEAVRGRLSKCGLETWNDRSSRFVGFRAGFIAVVIGPLPSKSDAISVLERARRCAPDANLRQAKHVAE